MHMRNARVNARRGHGRAEGHAQIQNTKYTCTTGQTRNKLLEQQWVHLTNHTAGHSRPDTTHLDA